MTLLGYHGRLAVIDLSTETVRVEKLDRDELWLYIGGKGLLYYLGYRFIPVEGEPLDPRYNALIVAPGMMAGLLPGSSKVGFLAKSPLTGILCDTYAGQVFAAKLKLAGYDALVIRGRASEPIYIYIENGRIELRSANHLWGATTWDTWQAIRAETRKGVSVAAIGPAGENRVRYANIIVDGFRAAGRGGLGAVMGSMRLKAIAVWGYTKPPVADPEGLKEFYREWYRKTEEDPALRAWAKYGTNTGIESCSRLSMCPGWHWNKPTAPEAEEKLSGKNILARENKLSYHEYAGVIWGWGCPAKCGKLASPRLKGYEHLVVKPEYENLAMLGLAVGVLDPDEILVTEWLVNSLGLDSISFGETVAWLIEVYEKGLIQAWELAGLDSEPRYGDPELVRKLARLVAYRRGIGAVLAEGVEKASRILGRGEQLAVHVKGLEAPAWDPRGRAAMALSYATADIGASHLRGWPPGAEPPSKVDPKTKIEGLIRDRDWKALLDSLGLCCFLPYKPDEVAKAYKLVTGYERPVEDLVMVGWRAEAIARVFAVLAGRAPEGDTVPEKWMQPIPVGPLEGEKAFRSREEEREAVKAYYQARGYDEYGVPTRETLKRLGLDWLIGDAEEARRRARRRTTWQPYQA